VAKPPASPSKSPLSSQSSLLKGTGGAADELKKLAPNPDAAYIVHDQYGIVQGTARDRVSLGGHWLVALGAVVIAALCTFGAVLEGVRTVRQSADAEARAITLPATVTGRSQLTSLRGAVDRWLVTFAFTTAQGESFSGEADIDRATFEAFTEGAAIYIKYLPENPRRSTLAFQQLIPIDLDLALIIGIVPAAGAAILTGRAVLISLRNRHFERRGMVLRGEITKAEALERGASYIVTLHYKFRTPDQREVIGILREDRDDLRKTALPKVGTEVAVLYVSDRLYRLL